VTAYRSGLDYSMKKKLEKYVTLKMIYESGGYHARRIFGNILS
jgi:hypothetical protein